jgi:ferritin-like metal-binding protein YciE
MPPRRRRCGFNRPELAPEAHDRELAGGFEQHLKQTRQQIANLEETFAKLGERAKGKPCAGIEGLKEEHDEFSRSPTRRR